MITVSNFEDIGALIEVIGSEYVMDGTVSKFVRIHKVTNSCFIIANAHDDKVFLQFNTNFNISAPVAVLDMDLNAEWFLGTVHVNDDKIFTFLTKEQMKFRGYSPFMDTSLSLKVRQVNELKERCNILHSDLNLHKELLEVEQIANRELTSSIERLSAEQLSYNQERVTLIREGKILEDANVNLQRNKQLLLSEISELRSSLSDVEKRRDDLLQSCSAQKQRIEVLEEEKKVFDLKLYLEKKEKEYAKVGQCEEEIKRLEGVISSISEENAALRQHKQILKNNNETLMDRLRKSKSGKSFNVSFEDASEITRDVGKINSLVNSLQKRLNDISKNNS